MPGTKGLLSLRARNVTFTPSKGSNVTLRSGTKIADQIGHQNLDPPPARSMPYHTNNPIG
jgi:hypothetical protein